MSDSSFKVACIQNNSKENINTNIVDAEVLTKEAHARGAQLICLADCR